MPITRSARTLLALAAAAALVSVPLTANAASVVPGGSSGAPLGAALNGANEVGAMPGAFVGDPDGAGTAALTVNIGQSELCYDISFTGIAPIFGHVHAGAAGANGPVVIGLPAVDNAVDSATGCVEAPRELLREIVKNPAGYYVNLHTAEFRGGAIRGQLGR